jgi:hypothetical protein
MGRRNRVKLRRLRAILLLLLSCPSLGSTTADELNKKLKLGMTRAQVLEILGAPREKVELGSKKQIVWIYPRANLIFEEATLNEVEQIRAGSIVPANALTQLSHIKDEEKISEDKSCVNRCLHLLKKASGDLNVVQVLDEIASSNETSSVTSIP